MTVGTNSSILDDGLWRKPLASLDECAFVLDFAMPRILDNWLDGTAYLYPSKKDAEEGVRSGGTGFLVGIRYRQLPFGYHIYAVTASHVVREGKSPVVRLNTHDGGTVILEKQLGDWHHHPDGDDVAACQIMAGDPARTLSFIAEEYFITREIASHLDVGPGDDVFMVGRFIGHDGKQRNLPSVRFGNISMMPGLVRNARGLDQESFMVEMKSLGGYSGSPVILWLLPNAEHMSKAKSRKGNWLLGIDWGHIPRYVDVLKDAHSDSPIDEGYVVKLDTGLAGVVPCWKLTELLEQDEEFAAQREMEEHKLKTNKARERSDAEKEVVAVFDSSVASPEDQQAFTKADFERALKKVARRPKDENK